MPIQIQVLNVSKIPATTTKGGAYEKLEVAYKDFSFNGAVKSKTLVPFGTGKSVYDTFANAVTGTNFIVETNKNAQGYIDWLSAAAGEIKEAQSKPAYTSSGQTSGRTFESEEERAKKQVYIVRQSSLSNAIALLSVGAKSAPKLGEVIETAKGMEAYVFGITDAGAAAEFEDVE